MRIACLGGGPGGLVFTILAKKAFPSAAVELWDRNPAGATYGFGVVFSDEAMDAIRRADEAVHAAIVCDRAHWGQIDVHLNGHVYTSRRNRSCERGVRDAKVICSRSRTAEAAETTAFTEALPLRRS